jgi:hypothetical protein
MSSDTDSPHLSDWQAAAYVDGRLSPVERARTEAHIEECATCRREVVEVAQVLGPVPQPSARPRRRTVVSGIGLAFAASLVLLLSRPQVTVETGRDQLRDDQTAGGTEGVARIAVVHPANGSTIGSTERVVTWRSAGADATYRLTLGNGDGRVLWRGATSDTTLALPPDVPLESGTTYFWHVDALIPAGASATTRVQSFTVRP